MKSLTQLRQQHSLIMQGMLEIKNPGIKEDCPIGLIDFNQWEWSQGVGLYGMYQYYKQTKKPEILKNLMNWYSLRIKEGLPPKNVNTMSPMLTLALLYEETGNLEYFSLCDEWCRWIIEEMPRTTGNGLQHVCIDRTNTEQLWDDTLFMTVLFLATWGKITNNTAYIEEAIYQFLLHSEYLKDKRTGLWYHGWSFERQDNFSKALWGRGNCWITIVIVDFIETINPSKSMKDYLINLLLSQVTALEHYQAPNGEWHTLLTDPSSYTETSATAGFGYGILKGIRLGLLDPQFLSCGLKALNAVSKRIDEKGILHQVSYGTAMGSNLDYYRNIPICAMPYGQALALMLLGEGLLMV